jgi:hypothetical protein
MTQPKDERQENIVAVIVEDDLNKKEREEREERGKDSAGVLYRIRQFDRQGACRKSKPISTPFGLP